MRKITKGELDRISAGLAKDRAAIIRHNPIGSEPEIMLWMLLGCLVSYLSLSEQETPCFTGKPDAETYASAVRFVIISRRSEIFDPEPYIERLTRPETPIKA